PLEQRIADPVGDAALHLPVHDQRVDQSSAVMRNRVIAQAHAAREEIDLDLGYVRPVGVGRLRWREVGRVLETRCLAPGEGKSRYTPGEPREFAETQRWPVPGAGGGAPVFDIDLLFRDADGARRERDDLPAH